MKEASRFLKFQVLSGVAMARPDQRTGPWGQAFPTPDLDYVKTVPKDRNSCSRRNINTCGSDTGTDTRTKEGKESAAQEEAEYKMKARGSFKKAVCVQRRLKTDVPIGAGHC